MRRVAVGFSLVELLVSITVLALAASIALVLFDGARRTFKLGENASEQQQMVRIAFDMLSQDLRMAGFNTNPDGDTTRPDEQIEATWDTAIAVRADFDADRATATTPELALANTAGGAAFLTVSTGNDEIVTYALANDASNDTLTFAADHSPGVRDGVVDPVVIDDVSLSQNDPPYTLYRITLAPDGAPVRTPLIDNVRSLRFTYYDESDQVVPALGGDDDTDGTLQRRRASIRRITVDVEGLTRDADLRWSDPDDPVPGPNNLGEYRKFKLTGDVTPRNLGKFGVKDLDAVSSPPSTPPPPSLEPGHCGGLYATWAPNPPQDEVARYELRYGTTSGALGQLAYAVEAEHFIGDLLHDTPYYVTVQAVDDSGNISSPSSEASMTTTNENTPEQPVAPTATQNRANRVELAWSAVQDNAGPPFLPNSDPLRPRLRDLAGYHVYRGADEDFAVTPGDTLTGGVEVGLAFTDWQVVNCRPYHYRLAAVDTCGVEGIVSDSAEGRSVYLTDPKPPENVQAFIQSSGTVVRLIWDPVNRDVNDDTIYIEDYRIYRTGLQPTGIVPPSSAFSLRASVNANTEFLDTIGAVPAGMTYYYRLVAHDACVNESLPSNIAEPTCTFDGDVVFVQPAGTWTATVQVDVSNGSGTYPQLSLIYSSLAGGGTVFQTSSAGPPWTVSWPASASASGPWQITAEVTQSNTCTQQTSVTVTKP